MKKPLCFIGCVVLLFVLSVMPVCAAVEYPLDVPYETYQYNSQSEPLLIPAAFTAQRTVTGTDLSDTALKNPSDLCCAADRIYLCDTEQNRILVTDARWNPVTVLTGAAGQPFHQPKGVWADDGHLYVADTGNARIVAFTVDGTAYTEAAVYGRPEIPALGADYVYSPTRLTVDSTGKMYVVAAGVNQGLVCLDEQGAFQGFLGAPRVEPNFLEALWRKIATKEQLARMESYVPTEYNAVTRDTYGFLYVVSQTSNSVPVGKLNSDGDNVLAVPESGSYADLSYLADQADYAPYFTDVALCSSGRIGEDLYFVLDSKQGKIYGYTEDGTLLFAFGANGVQQGTFYSATAIEYLPGEDGGAGQLLVTDGFKNTVTVFQETDFLVHVRRALRLYNSGEYEQARAAWTEVSRQAGSYTPAIVGLSRIALHDGDYAGAMNSLMAIREHKLYAEAFENRRDGIMRQYFAVFLLVLAGVAVLVPVLRRVFRKSRAVQRVAASPLYQSCRYGTYVMLHPFDGFWDLKNEKRGNVRSATIIAALFFLIYALRAEFSGYVVTGIVSSDVNALYDVAMILLPLAFYILANWCFTTLMDGKGTMRDIYISVCYALTPYVVFGLPLLLLSNVLTESEAAFYTVFNTLVWAWVLFLLFAGLMMTHDYSLGKTVLTVILVLVGICLIVFIILLVISIGQNVYQFFYNTYQELSFRSY